MSSMLARNTSRGSVSSVVMSAPMANLIKTMQSQQVEKALQLKLEVKGKDYDWEVDASLDGKSTKSIVYEVNNVFYPFLLSQDIDEMYVPPAVASYLKLISSYEQSKLIPNMTGIYLAGAINEIKIYRMPTEVFKDDCTCVCHTKHDEWVKAKIANVSSY